MAKEKEYSILVNLQVFLDCLIKTLQKKTQWEQILAKKKGYNQHISFRVFTPPHEYIDLQLSMKRFLTHANIMNNLLEYCSSLSCDLIVSA
jgi:hypothetical protein